jgi:hypothetical protein
MTKLSTLALGLLLCAAPASAISVSFVPSSIDTAVGSEISFDVVVSDLGGESVGSYDLDLSFDGSKLAFTSFDFGAFLGGTAASLQSAGAAGGVLDAAEVSLLLPAELDALQGDSFALGTVRFAVLAEGTSDVNVTQAIVGNGVGRPLQVGSVGSVRVNAGPAIPEPSAFALFGIGLTAVAWRSRRGRLAPRRLAPATVSID